MRTHYTHRWKWERRKNTKLNNALNQNEPITHTKYMSKNHESLSLSLSWFCSHSFLGLQSKEGSARAKVVFFGEYWLFRSICYYRVVSTSRNKQKVPAPSAQTKINLIGLYTLFNNNRDFYLAVWAPLSSGPLFICRCHCVGNVVCKQRYMISFGAGGRYVLATPYRIASWEFNYPCFGYSVALVLDYCCCFVCCDQPPSFITHKIHIMNCTWF